MTAAPNKRRTNSHRSHRNIYVTAHPVASEIRLDYNTTRGGGGGGGIRWGGLPQLNTSLLPFHPSIHPSIRPQIYPSIYRSVHLFFHPAAIFCLINHSRPDSNNSNNSNNNTNRDDPYSFFRCCFTAALMTMMIKANCHSTTLVYGRAEPVACSCADAGDAPTTLRHANHSSIHKTSPANKTLEPGRRRNRRGDVGWLAGWVEEKEKKKKQKREN